MRLRDCRMILALCALAAAACSTGVGRSHQGGGYIYPVKEPSAAVPQFGQATEHAIPTSRPDKSILAVHIDKDGLIYLGGRVVTEEELLAEAKKALQAAPGIVAVLLVESGMMQGIHLSAELGKLGYKNVQVYYPTATNR